MRSVLLALGAYVAFSVLVGSVVIWLMLRNAPKPDGPRDGTER